MLFYKKNVANFIIIIMINIGGIRNTIRTAENHQDPSSYWHQSSSLKSSSAGGRDDEEEGLKTGSSTINRRLKRRQQQQPQHAAGAAGDPHVIDLTSSGHQEKLVSDEQLDHQSVASMILTGGGAMNKPYFEAAWPQNVSVVLGQPIALKCRTRLLGDRMVCLLIIPFPINQLVMKESSLIEMSGLDPSGFLAVDSNEKRTRSFHLLVPLARIDLSNSYMYVANSSSRRPLKIDIVCPSQDI